MKTINKCEVCGNQSLIEVLDLGKHPLCDECEKYLGNQKL